MSHLIVAIDGPSGVGKTTVARRVAQRLGVPYLETGAMYRAVAVEVLERELDPSDREAVEALTKDIGLELRPDEAGRLEVLLHGETVEERIRGLEVARTTSRISIFPGVRAHMVAIQRRVAAEHGGVLEGRDIGSKVFPETPHKFFLDALLEIRARRRWHQLQEQRQVQLELKAVEQEVRERDARDRSRADSPLRYDKTYTLIDTSRSTVEEVVEQIVGRVVSANAATSMLGGSG